MKFIAVRDFRTYPAKVWKELSENGEMVVTNNGKPIALLAPLSDKDLEETISAYRKAKAISAVQKMREISMKQGTSKMTSHEINKIIKLSREKNNNLK